jgi:hypothetical protein
MCQGRKLKKLIAFLILFMAATAQADIDLEPNCVADYNMNDDAANTTVVDAMGSYNGTAQQNTSDMHVAGKINGALTFNGTSDYINTNTFQSVFQSDFSISFWIKPTDGQPSSGRGVMGAINPVQSYEAKFSQSTGGNLYFTYKLSVLLSLFLSSVIWDDGETPWKHVTLVIYQDDADVKGEMYVNGILVTSSQIEGQMSDYLNGGAFFIGKVYGTPPTYFDGLIDNVIISNKALSTEEITFLYYNGKGTEQLTDHYSDVNQLPDCHVNFEDYALFADDWMAAGTASDFDGSGAVDIYDLEIFCYNWLKGAPICYCEGLPSKATNPDPADDSNDVLLDSVLAWTVTDCNGENTLNDVWFGETGLMTKVITAQDVNSYAPVSMEKSHTYQWRIDTINNNGTTTGDVWDFNTITQDPPVAESNSISAYTYIVKTITLSATDDGYPLPSTLTYYITALPANGYLRDANGCGKSIIESGDLPYLLCGGGKKVCYETTIAGETNFSFKAYDGELYSDANTVTITTAANLLDCVNFDGLGYITIADDANFDIEPNRGIGVCFNTLQSNCTILKKWESGKGGYELDINDGYVAARVYDNSGTLVAEQKTDYRHNDGTWVNAVFCFNYLSEKLELFIGYGSPMADEPNFLSEDEIFMDSSAADFPRESWPASNDCNLVVGQGFKWGIDAIRTYNFLLDNNKRTISSIQVREVSGDTGLAIPSPAVRFKCNYDGTNNTNTQIYDDVSASHLIGTFSSSFRVRYYPFYMCPCNLAQ